MQPEIEILLVDDNPNDIFAFQLALEDLAFNFALHYKSDGVQALEFIKGHAVDIVITDFNMPVLSGLRLMQALKSSKYSHIPVVFLSASNSQYDIDEAYKNGCAFYLNKPLNQKELQSLVDFVNTWVNTVKLPARINREGGSADKN